MVLSWFVFSLLATFLLGVSMAFYKLASSKNQSRYVVAFWMLFVALILSFLFFHNFLYLTNYGMVLTAIFWGVSFGFLMLLQMYALEKIDTNALFPITTTLSLVFVVIFGFLFFKEIISAVQFFGMLLVGIVVYSYLYKERKLQYSKHLLIIGVSIIAFSVFNKIIQKVVA